MYDLLLLFVDSFRGASSVVRKAKHKGTENEYAVKTITKTVSETRRFRFPLCA